MSTGSIGVHNDEGARPQKAPVPTAAEARAARETLGLTVEQLAPELGLTPAVVSAWEAGRMRVPRRIMAELRWRAAVHERTRALDASGLPVCAWVARWHADSQGLSLRQRRARLEVLMEHTRVCPTCVARETFLAEQFPPLPPRPVPGWMGFIGWFGDRIQRLPRWLRPAATGSLVFAGYSVVRIVLLSRELMTGSGAASAAEGLLGSVLLGGAIGLGYSGYRVLRERRAARRAA